MTLAAFLPRAFAVHVRTTVPNEQVLFAQSWQELDSLVALSSVNVGILDPSASGAPEIATVIALIRKHPSVPLLAYVPLTEQSFRAVATLSKYGLADAIVHPSDEKRLGNAIDTCGRTSLIRELLGTLEVALAKLSPEVLRAVQDLFERPKRYETGADIARSARTPIKNVYRDFQAADLGTPKKLVTVAKLLCGYCYLRSSSNSIRGICRKLGYSRPQIFAEYSSKVFGCYPSSLRTADDVEVVRSLLDWFYKPSGKSIGRATPSDPTDVGKSVESSSVMGSMCDRSCRRYRKR